jgi:hypothetical protein
MRQDITQKLHNAIKSNQIDKVPSLVKEVKDINQVFSIPDDKSKEYTFLTLAVFSSMTIIKLLIAAGADVNIRANQGTALEVVVQGNMARHDSIDRAKLFLAKGARITDACLSYEHIDLNQFKNVQELLVEKCAEGLNSKMLKILANRLEANFVLNGRGWGNLEKILTGEWEDMGALAKGEHYKTIVTNLDAILNSGSEVSCMSRILRVSPFPEEVFDTLNPNGKKRNVEGYAESLRAELDVRLPKVLSNIVGEYCLGEGSWQQRISEESSQISVSRTP